MLHEGTKAEIQYFLRKSEEDLFSLIGSTRKAHYVDMDLMVRRARDRTSEALRLGQMWFEENGVLFFGRLCVQNRMCEKIKGTGFSDEVTLVLAIADIVCALCVNIPPFAVSALLVKKGIKELCYCDASMSKETKDDYMRRAAQIWRLQNNVIKQLDFEGLPEQHPKREACRYKKGIAKAIVHHLFEPKWKRLLEESDIPLPGSRKSNKGN